MSTITMQEAKLHLEQIIARLPAECDVIITDNGQPVARLTPVKPSSPSPQFGNCRGALTILSDDDEHLEDFKEYLP